MSQDKEKRVTPPDDMALRLATARSSDIGGQAIFPVTSNLTAEEEIIDPEEIRNADFDAGA
jgi:hypothetical protein